MLREIQGHTAGPGQKRHTQKSRPQGPRPRLNPRIRILVLRTLASWGPRPRITITGRLVSFLMLVPSQIDT